MTTANKITLLRVVMIPIFMAAVLVKEEYAQFIALAIFILASLTDSIDGYVARKYNQSTNFGIFLDPLADKLLVTSAILVFVERGQMPSWAAMIIIAREFAVTGLRLVAVGEGQVIAAAMSGKIKTAVSIIAICIMLTPMHIKSVMMMIDTACYIIMTVVTLWSGAEYFIKNRKILNFRK
jgi:CDP-diacylglycerol--glycerol-3-phosphate 3-phosphatidyltransferase